ncbi:H-NS family nucleoid-associated regulatory protein [Neptuniibacter sp.]|uniref:H-NS histone family protein n=1 Tax=Neptuniibacter sp. TaxID=1962643 RepID=UPI003B5AFD38
MSDFLKILTRKNSLRKNIQELSSEDIQKVISNLSEIHLEKEKEEQALEEAAQAKQDKIDEIAKMMKEAGLNFDDVMGAVAEVKQKKKVEAKYRLDTVEWSGRGRTPVAIKAYLEAGGSLADIEI